MTAHLASPTVPAARRVTGRFTPSAAPAGPPPATPGRIDPPLPGARPGSDFAELSRRVKAAGLMARRPGYYAVKITLTAALLVGGWSAFVLIGRSWWQMATAVLLGIAFTQVAFLGHDAGHKQIFRTRRGSYVLGLLHANLAVGLSYGWWIDKHNRHHAHPNEIGRDPDIGTGALVFVPDERRRHRISRLLTRAQAYIFFPLLLLEGLNLHVAGLLALRERPLGSRWLEGALLALHLAGYAAVVFLVLGPLQAMVFIAVQQGVFGFYMGCSFAPNHKGMPILSPGRGAGLPPAAGAHLPQRPRWPARGFRAGRAELPDRAPPLPQHAAAEPPPGPGRRPPVLPGPGDQLHRDVVDGVVRDVAAAPARDAGDGHRPVHSLG